MFYQGLGNGCVEEDTLYGKRRSSGSGPDWSKGFKTKIRIYSRGIDVIEIGGPNPVLRQCVTETGSLIRSTNIDLFVDVLIETLQTKWLTFDSK